MIDRLALQQALAGLQRTQAASPSEKAGKGASPPNAASAQHADARGLRGAGFEQQVRQRVAQIHPGDPERRRRALRIVIEASLLKEFGERLGSDPAFHAIVDEVTRTVDADPALADTISLALQGLLSPPAAGE
jgi:hypothetical protein